MEGVRATPDVTLAQPRRTGLVIALPSWRRFVLLLVPAVVLFVAGYGTGFAYKSPERAKIPTPKLAATTPAALKKEAGKLKNERRNLEATLRGKVPKSNYLIIDQTHNRLRLMKDEQTVLDAKCSAGSGMVLQEEGGKNRKWVFDTPRGQFRVLNRISDPIWKKPDWAFVEEGQPIPKDPEERFERGTLGEYALYFGNGYMVHGTLYERLLGRSVTHGCIRLGRDDLRVVWANAPIGTPIYIY